MKDLVVKYLIFRWRGKEKCSALGYKLSPRVLIKRVSDTKIIILLNLNTVALGLISFGSYCLSTLVLEIQKR